MIPDITPHIAVVRVFRPLIPLSETFSVIEAHRLSQGDAGCHHQMARTVGKVSDTSHLTPLPLPMSKKHLESCELCDNIFEIERQLLELDSCFIPPHSTPTNLPLHPRGYGVQVSCREE